MGIEETKVFEEFRNAVKELDQTEPTLRRFLKARNYNLVKAEDMLRKYVKWRETNKVDDALSWKISDLIMDNFPIEYPGIDLKNRAVMYLPLGAWPVRTMVEAGHGEEMIRYITVVMERMVQEIMKTGEHFTFILDLESLSFWTCAHVETLQMILRVFREFEAYYPERLAEALVINAPLVFNVTWPLVKPLLTGNTMSKLTFLGCNKGKILAAMQERMPNDSLPTKYRKLVEKK